MEYPQKVDVKSGARTEPQHPCDPPVPCDPFKEPEGDCFPPFLCYDRLKNPEDPNHLTRCRPGASIGVKTCFEAGRLAALTSTPHPCDPPPLCSSLGPPKKTPCDEPILRKERIKNPELQKIRRVKCKDSKGTIIEIEIKK